MSASSGKRSRVVALGFLLSATCCQDGNVAVDAPDAPSVDAPDATLRDAPPTIRRDSPDARDVAAGWIPLDAPYPELCPIDIASPELLADTHWEPIPCATDPGQPAVFGDGETWCRRIVSNRAAPAGTVPFRSRYGSHDGTVGLLTVIRDDGEQSESWAITDDGRTLAGMRSPSSFRRRCSFFDEGIGDGAFADAYVPNLAGRDVAEEYLVGTPNVFEEPPRYIGYLGDAAALSGTSIRYVGPSEVVSIGGRVWVTSWEGETRAFPTQPFIGGGVVAPYATLMGVLVPPGVLQVHVTEPGGTSPVPLIDTATQRYGVARGGGRLAWYDIYDPDATFQSFARIVLRSAVETGRLDDLVEDVSIEVGSGSPQRIVVGPNHVARIHNLTDQVDVEIIRLSDGATATIPPASDAVALGFWEPPLYITADEIALERLIRDPAARTLDVRFIRLDALTFTPP